MLPSGPMGATSSQTALPTNQQPMAAMGKPPPLPPKPRVGGPPLPPRESSSPPPVPPRLPPSRPPTSYGGGFKPPLESRPPCIEPVFPRRSVDNSSNQAAASLPPIVPRSRNGEPSPRWVEQNQQSSPHIRGLSAPPPPDRIGGSSAPGKKSKIKGSFIQIQITGTIMYSLVSSAAIKG